MAASENIAVLFTDLVDSTKLASALTPEAAGALRRAHFSALRQAVAASGGSEVKTLGDGLMVVFPVASAALSCAVAMQQAVDRDNLGASRPLGLRVGISVGEVSREEDDFFGDPVIEAARLCASAVGGQILVADLVRAMAGRRSSHAFIPRGALELKGLPEPVEALEVVWEPWREGGEAAAMPAPPRLGPGAFGVIGRDTETALLADAFKRVAAGGGARSSWSRVRRGSGRPRSPPRWRVPPSRPGRSCYWAAATRTSVPPTGPSSRPSPTM